MIVDKENKYLIYDVPKERNAHRVINCIHNVFDNVYYKILYRLFRPKSKPDYLYKTSICAIFKDESDYLKEWIEYHIIIGAEHFYLYNNASEDNYLEVLQPYIDKGLITLYQWPKPQSQMEAYEHCVTNHSQETHWIGFIDLDEYVVPNKMDNINVFLKDFENRPMVIIYWKCFGTSGLIDRDKNGLITEEFTVSWPKYSDIGKFFFNTSYDYLPKYKKNSFMHYRWAKYKNIFLPPVNIFDKVCTRNCNPVKSDEMPIQINHYLLKSYEEYVSKKAKRGGGVNPVGVHDLSYFFEHEMKCSDTDYHIYKYLIKLKLAMQVKRQDFK